MQIVVQTIRTRWTKLSRSAPAATRRNAVPEALAVDEAVLRSTAVFAWHHVYFDERTGFAPDHGVVTTDEVRSSVAQVGLQRDGASLIVELFGETCFSLVGGEHGLVVYNRSEDSLAGDWRERQYEKLSCHVGVDLPRLPGMFLERPTYAFRRMRDLR